MYTYIGKVAKCSKGLVGIIEGQKELPWGPSWVGKRVKDGEPWASRNPEVLAPSLFEFQLDLTRKGMQKAVKIFRNLEGYHGAGVGVDAGEDGSTQLSITLRFSKKPDGLAKFPEHLDVDGFDIPLDAQIVTETQ